MKYLYLTILFPLISFLVLALGTDRFSEKQVKLVTLTGMALSVIATIVVGYDFMSSPNDQQVYHQVLWKWMQIGSFAPNFGLSLDGLSLTMMCIILGVGFLIQIFSTWYMTGEPGYQRFFSYMNLFIVNMLLLVLADNLLLLYLGWEGVGLCSYLLIGFYFKNRANGRAAMKAFTVTRLGDTFLAIGLCLIFWELGTLTISDINSAAPGQITESSTIIVAITLMLLGGAVGKSAQLPLQTWLADAMAGPTPVSALIHAATMVTAGVYLIARMHPLFELAPQVLLFVGQIGTVTLVIAGFSALVQTDIKRILAYSTMSQLGYMFMALGVGAWQSSIYHLMIHAFFKALLFLSAGAVIISVHHEQNIFKMGGLRKTIPFVWVCFLIGGGALVALPFISAGYYSKDEILWEAWASQHPELFWWGILGAFFTSIYTFRMIWFTFYGPEKTHASRLNGISYWLPLGVLAILSTFIGALIHPPLASVLPESIGEELIGKGDAKGEGFVKTVAICASLGGLLVAAFFYVYRPLLVEKIRFSKAGEALSYWWYNGWGFDRLNEIVFIKPYLVIGKILKPDPLDLMVETTAISGAQLGNKLAVRTQNGSVRSYLGWVIVGLILILLTVYVVQTTGQKG